MPYPSAQDSGSSFLIPCGLQLNHWAGDGSACPQWIYGLGHISGISGRLLARQLEGTRYIRQSSPTGRSTCGIRSVRVGLYWLLVDSGAYSGRPSGRTLAVGLSHRVLVAAPSRCRSTFRIECAMGQSVQRQIASTDSPSGLGTSDLSSHSG
ncbi:putative nucleotide triphosphate hydrolase [Pseudomonas phage PIP]|nr:putative nucleotide triphosphate hydrolase [Pseudomonas phage PIP]